jgi:hypothetical protein
VTRWELPVRFSELCESYAVRFLGVAALSRRSFVSNSE